MLVVDTKFGLQLASGCHVDVPSVSSLRMRSFHAVDLRVRRAGFLQQGDMGSVQAHDDGRQDAQIIAQARKLCQDSLILPSEKIEVRIGQVAPE
jgi:hypothetical protein